MNMMCIYKITDLSNSVKAYLSDGDIDFYIINNSSISLGYEPITYHGIRQFYP